MQTTRLTGVYDLYRGKTLKEVDVQKVIYEFLKRKLHCLSNKQVSFAREVPVPYRTLFGTRDNPAKIVVKCFNQDLCIFENWAIDDMKNEQIIKIEASYKSEFKESYGIVKTNSINIPYVIIEMKVSNNTDTFLAYKEKTRMIKECFPWVKYCLCMVGKGSPRLIEDGVTFDKIVVLSDTEEATLEKEKFAETVESLFMEAEERKKQYFNNVEN